ncbi:MAG: lytic transglycosylase domain-containing protein [Candidatus Angelobacter sp.]
MIGTALLLGQLTAFGAEIAVLHNGFSIRFERKEQTGNLTRLYTDTGYLDVASDQIASFETEEAPVAPAPQSAVPQESTAPKQQPAASKPADLLSMANPQTATNNTVTPIKSATPATNVDLDQLVREASSHHRLDPDFVSSVIKAESNFKTRAVSKKGAQGLMQLMPGTAAQLGVADPFDPRANVEAGTAHLSALLDQYHDDPIKALAAYNAGAHRVKQYHGVPPYRETRTYISKIIRDFNAKKRAQMKTGAASKVNASAKPAGASAKPVNSKASKRTKPQQASITKPASPA